MKQQGDAVPSNPSSGPAPREALTTAQRELLEMVRGRRAITIYEVSDRLGDLLSLVRLGYLGILVEQYPWGLEFTAIAKGP